MNSTTAGDSASLQAAEHVSLAPVPSPAPEPMLVLLDAARRIECRLEDALVQVGLSIAKFQALDALVRADTPTRLSALAGSLDCVRSNVTQLADRLESDGLIKRVASPDDRRAVHAVVTSLGRRRHAEGAAAVHRLQGELAAQVAPADRESFHRVLSALR
ncbi:MAG TPA: MarR family transcriptional regulator [Gemmatimonadaceae bacterium]